MSNELLFSIGFLLFIVLILALDLGLFSRKEHVVSLKQAGIMSLIMIVLAIGFYFI
ncbi:MAG: TerC family protein, partial [Pedobacter sp.]